MRTYNELETIYFQTPDIKPQYCEIGMISETDKEYIWYLEDYLPITCNSDFITSNTP
jgi:hypothetical protein